MNDYTKDLKNLGEFFKTKGLENRLNVSEELLYMYIGIANSADGGFIEALQERTGMQDGSFELFLDAYTLEVGAIMGGVMQEIGEIISSEDREYIEKNMSRIAKEIEKFLGSGSAEILSKIVEHYQSEYEIFKSSCSSSHDLQESCNLLEENSQLLNLDVSKIATIPKEDHYVIIAMLLQEIFMLMGIVNFKEMESGNMQEYISQEEYENEDFDMKESMKKAMQSAASEHNIIYEKADFAYSLTDKVVCNICHGFFAPKSIQRHVGSCAKKYVEDGEDKSSYLLKISDKYMKDYFLHVLVSEDAILNDVDTFLRDIWLECCGHMSAFRQGYDELEMDDYVECLTHTKKTEYTYDFGSSTNLIIEFKKEFKGSQEHLIKLVARNAKVDAKCHRCEKKDAKYICTECMYGGDEVLFCEDCVKKHTKKYHDEEDYMISNFVNSPRTGVCGYGAMEEEL